MGDTISLSPARTELRALARARRRAIPDAERKRSSLRAALLFLRTRKLARARRIAAYVAMGTEIDPAPLVQALLGAGRRVYLPKVRDAEPMHLVQLRAGARLRRGKRGVSIPALRSPRASVQRLDLVLLPLVAFDAAGTRLGTGGGAYDRLLARKHPSHRPLLVGYAFAEQRVARIPREPWDRPLDAVITERGVTWFPQGAS
jgi:5-formyltetrahydrofolate cyclo-ligase